MQEKIIEQEGSHGDDTKIIVVQVNNHPVTFREHVVTGLKIKETAISQGVAIEEDFNLFQVKKGSHLQPISDDEIIKLQKHDEFRATAPDDNS